ncbi:hypothetical protein LUR56_40165 [Streptomyces sp. MT29]|nr:hypothetical protein [Streptomyces sp. MT29]
MATNTTPKKPTSTTAEEHAPDPETTSDRTAPVVGPPLPPGQTAETVTLSHHLRIGGTDYIPGAQIHVSPDYARRLRGQGFTART